jgi:hypothetical protein
MNRCPVNETIKGLEKSIESGALKDPRLRRIGEEILELLQDVAWGRAGNDHVPAIKDLSQTIIADAPDDQYKQVGQMVASAVEEHEEIFNSHVQTHNCATGDCVRLAPAPCQMACPAGIDVPAYVSLIGMGRDAEAIEVIRKDNPFPWVCGLVCTRPCEFMCVRGRIDKPISIKFLKAFAAEKAFRIVNIKTPKRLRIKTKKSVLSAQVPEE